ncbi:hypothetical protein [Streptomyces sp. NPDC088726]|uniref:hypothetical protein n=1 Tax=Streptomyces sp. NPDC088726 TaxID=3365874 RepID=UPI0037F7A561
MDELLADPARVGPVAAGRAWLPADVLTHIAQQTAQLLDAEVRPLREEPVDRATVGLRPETEPGAVVPPPGGDTGTGTKPDTEPVPEPKSKKEKEKQRDKSPRRRRTNIALPVCIVLGVEGGTVAVLQPWSGGGGGVHAQTPGDSVSPTSGGGGSPGGQGGSPSGKAKEKGKGSGGGRSKPSGHSLRHPLHQQGEQLHQQERRHRLLHGQHQLHGQGPVLRRPDLPHGARGQ